MAEFEAQFSALQSWVNRIGINREGQNQNSSLCLIIKSPDQKVSSIIVYDLLSFCKKYAKHLALKVFFHRHDFKRESRTGTIRCLPPFSFNLWKHRARPQFLRLRRHFFERCPQKCVAKHASVLPTLGISPFEFQLSSF